MTWLVLSHEGDDAASWVAEGLAAAGLHPLLALTDSDFAGARWDHRLGCAGVSTRVSLADGRLIDCAVVRGTVNRLVQPPPTLAQPMREEDRDYALQELSALFLSWLAALPGPVLNPPDPRGLAGAWRSPAEWLHLAAGCGLGTNDLAFDSAAGGWFADGWACQAAPDLPPGENVLVVGTAVFSDREIDAATVDACRHLAEASRTPILGIAFADDTCDSVAAVTPLPDLRAGGDELIDALAEVLRGEGGAA